MHRVRTLTGKEIELDIEPDYKVNRLPCHDLSPFLSDEQTADILIGLTYKRACRGEGGDSACAAEVDLRRETDVRLLFFFDCCHWVC